jgi:hypothetical protein
MLHHAVQLWMQGGGPGLTCPIPRHSSNSCMSRNLKLQPWSLCSSLRTPNWQEELVTKASAIVDGHLAWLLLYPDLSNQAILGPLGQYLSCLSSSWLALMALFNS